MAEVRAPRETLSRDKTARMVYQPASALPDPNPEPGYVFRWIATHVMGQSDPSNVSKRLREGWEPVRAEDHPELSLFAGTKGNVELGGLMLCKMPEELAKSRNEYYATQTARQMESVDNSLMRNNDSRMPLFNDRESRATKGRGFGNGT